MNIIEPSSSFSVQADFSLSDTDFVVLSLLYLPILKGDAHLLYQVLFDDRHYFAEEGVVLHEDLFSDLGLEESAFLKARRKLEAIGLLETYRKEKADENGTKVFYSYRLLPPASPKKFFDDPILKNLLLQNISQKKYFRLLSFFRKPEKESDGGYQEVSERFKDVFSVALSEVDLKKSDGVETKLYKEISHFDKKLLEDYLIAASLPLKAIEPYEKDIIELARLYGIDEKKTLQLMEECFDSDFHFYFDKFNKMVRSLNRYVRDEDAAKEKAALGKENASAMVRLFRSTTPKEYLQAFFHAEPSPFMLKEVEKLRTDFGFDNGVINVILDYSLKKTDKEFNSLLIEKVAYSLSANGVQDCYDALVRLKTRDFSVANNKKMGRANKAAKKNENIKEVQEEEVTKDELTSLLGKVTL